MTTHSQYLPTPSSASNLNLILDYSRSRPAGPNSLSLAELYGTENFGLFIFSLLRMQRPETVVELGFGSGTTACLMAQSLRENNKGLLWSVDNGSDWKNSNLRQWCQNALGSENPKESCSEFASRLFKHFGLEEFSRFVQKQLTDEDFFCPGKPIDILFADAPDSDAQGCLKLLRYYLPRMSHYSAIFIDRASTINHSYLLLNHIVAELGAQRIPISLISDLAPQPALSIKELVEKCQVSIVHLTEDSEGKQNAAQNSRAWIRIEPRDFMPHNNVRSYF